MERNHSRRGKDGQCRGEQRGSKDCGDLRRQLRRRALRDVRKGLRSAIYFCVAYGALCGDERGCGGRDAGGN